MFVLCLWVLLRVEGFGPAGPTVKGNAGVACGCNGEATRESRREGAGGCGCEWLGWVS